MISDDRPASTLCSYAKSSKKGIPFISVDEKFYAKILGEMVEVVVCPKSTSKTQNSTIMILDQITDPRNVGAILRSAAVFGAAAVILPNRNATRLTGVLAKSASGALDVVPLAHANNLVRTMELLKNSGYWCIGLDSQSKTKIPSSPQAAHQAITVGAEGSGLRRLTKEKCDMVYKIPSTGRVKSLNVSTAAAVALFALSAKEQTE